MCADTSMILLIINLRIKVWLKIIHLWDIVSFLLLLIKILYFLIDSIASLIWNNLRSSCILYNHSSFSLVLDDDLSHSFQINYSVEYFYCITLILHLFNYFEINYFLMFEGDLMNWNHLYCDSSELFPPLLNGYLPLFMHFLLLKHRKYLQQINWVIEFMKMFASLVLLF